MEGSDFRWRGAVSDPYTLHQSRSLYSAAALNLHRYPLLLPSSGEFMVRDSVAPVLCTTRLVTWGGRKPTTCALRRSGEKSLPCERRDPSASSPVPSSVPLPHCVLCPQSDFHSAHRCSCCCSSRSIGTQVPTNPQISLHSVLPHNQYRGMHAPLLHSRAFKLLTLSISLGRAGHLCLLSRAQEAPSELP